MHLHVYSSAFRTRIQVNMDIFSIRLKEERTAKGFSQRYMAERLQIAQGTYKGYELVGEKNGREPSIEMIRRIAQILEVNSDYLLGLEE